MFKGKNETVIRHAQVSSSFTQDLFSWRLPSPDEAPPTTHTWESLINEERVGLRGEMGQGGGGGGGGGGGDCICVYE